MRWFLMREEREKNEDDDDEVCNHHDAKFIIILLLCFSQSRPPHKHTSPFREMSEQLTSKLTTVTFF